MGGGGEGEDTRHSTGVLLALTQSELLSSHSPWLSETPVSLTSLVACGRHSHDRALKRVRDLSSKLCVLSMGLCFSNSKAVCVECGARKDWLSHSI